MRDSKCVISWQTKSEAIFDGMNLDPVRHARFLTGFKGVPTAAKIDISAREKVVLCASTPPQQTTSFTRATFNKHQGY